MTRAPVTSPPGMVAASLRCAVLRCRCCFKTGDLRRLAVCRERLARSRSALERAHGPHLERLKTIAGSHVHPELATWVLPL